MAYATTDELLRRIRISDPTPEQEAQAQQALDAATLEIDSYLTDAEGAVPSFAGADLALLAIVNIERAAEHWRVLPFGALNTGADLPPVLTARDSFYRHARKLQPLKTSWGLA